MAHEEKIQKAFYVAMSGNPPQTLRDVFANEPYTDEDILVMYAIGRSIPLIVYNELIKLDSFLFQIKYTKKGGTTDESDR